LLVFLY